VRAYVNVLIVVVLAATLAVSCGKKKGEKPNVENPQTAADYVHRAKANFLSPDKAIKDATKAIEIDPKYAPAYEFRAERYTQLYDKTTKAEHARNAIADYDRLLDLKPAPDKAAEYYRSRGLLRMKIEDYDGAITDFRASGKARRGEPRTYEYLAQAFLAKNDRDNALKAYGIAIKFDPRNTSLLKARANIYSDMQDYDKAIADLMKVVEIQPDNDTYIALGKICEAKGDKLAAIDWYSKVKESDKPAPQ